MSIVITHAVRTPIGRFLGGLKDFTAVELGTFAVKSLLERSGIDGDAVDEVFFGNGRQAGGGPNPARQIAVRAGIPVSKVAMTINKACGSGLEAIAQAHRTIALGESEVVIAGGTESMSRVPFELDLREGLRLGHATLHDGNFRDGFQCPLADQLMGRTAENLAEKYGITRPEQDDFAAASQRKAEIAIKAGRFAAEIAPIVVTDRKGNETKIAADEHPRAGTTAASLAELPAVFKKDGTVTAGNSSGMTDGAACVLVMREEKAKALGLKPLARILGYASAGCEPREMGLGPAPATAALFRKLKQQAGRGYELYDFDVIELNEAFAAQVLACDREMKLPMDRINVNGGSIALGHPIGATGCRIVVTLLHEMKRLELANGLATLCISGGLGMSMAFENAG
jgi:acetyl-CoA C-acetyltransferase